MAAESASQQAAHSVSVIHMTQWRQQIVGDMEKWQVDF